MFDKEFSPENFIGSQHAATIFLKIFPHGFKKQEPTIKNTVLKTNMPMFSVNNHVIEL
ncbi:MAG: hypothetical protein H0X62_10385 [Bacteroidetes bacterium]|nr:hypothetical protein [Bacteroidota bacterium]